MIFIGSLLVTELVAIEAYAFVSPILTDTGDFKCRTISFLPARQSSLAEWQLSNLMTYHISNHVAALILLCIKAESKSRLDLRMLRWQR